MDIVERLQRAADSGEGLTIAYHGGSRPGATREIAVIKVTPVEIRARCYMSGMVKTFKVSKIEIPDEPDVARTYDPDADRTVASSLSIRDLLGPRVEELAGPGWHVEIDEGGISVHRYFKNGRPQKDADAGILASGGFKDAPLVRLRP